VLHCATPNPAAPGTTLRFDLPRRGPVDLAVYDVRGRRVRTLFRGIQDAGPHARSWDGRAEAGTACAAGVYFVRLTTADATLARKLVLLR
jgi:flagellar hook assembly protein FlgD